MTISLSDCANRIQPSPTLVISAKAAELKAKGKDIISLSVGEPDFDTPEHIKQAAINALHEGKTKYTPVPGTPSLRKAIIEKFQFENKLNYELNQIIVSCGAKHSIFNVCMALLNPHDEAIIPTPYWVSYPDIVKITGATPVLVQSDIEQKYKITADQLETAITPKTKLVFLNSPSNPSGIIYSPAELLEIAKVLLKHPQIYIITDDIYEHIIFKNKEFSNIVNICPDLYDRTIVVNGVSKAYAMTGWRIGYAAGPTEIIAAMIKIQSQCTSGACSIAQAASEEALKGDNSSISNMVTAFYERHNFVYNYLKNIPNIHVIPSEGTFYSFPNMQKVIDNSDKINSDIELSEYLLNEAGVAITPGTAFGSPGAMRLSYAVDMESLQTSLNRLKIIIDQLT